MIPSVRLAIIARQLRSMRLTSSDSSIRLSDEDALEMSRELLEYDPFAVSIHSVSWMATHHIVRYCDDDENELTFVKSYSTRGETV